MSALLHRLGGFAARRAPWVLLAWVVITVGLVLFANSVGRPENNNLELPGTGSQSATNLLDQRLPDQANGSVPIVLQSDTSLAEGQNKQAVDATVKSLSQNQYVHQALSPFSEQGAGDITKDGKIAYIAVALTVSSGDLDDDEANSVLDAADPASKAGIKVSAGGYLGPAALEPEYQAQRDHRDRRRADHPALRLQDVRLGAASGDDRGDRALARAWRSSGSRATSSTCRRSRRRWR